jgi:geranylgeranyl diphosphate synthase, type I
MTGMERLAPLRSQIAAALRRHLAIARPHLETVHTLGATAADTLTEYVARGKLIRGALAIVGAHLTQPEDALERALVQASQPLLEIASCLELVQSFLLVHDDVMDQDPIRRGGPAVHEQFRQEMADAGGRDPVHYGNSQAISVGDVAMLIAVNVLSSVELEPLLRIRLVELLTREIATVGIAQMADVRHGHARDEPTEAEITTVYRYKTGRYTFSLPLMLGAIVGGAPEETIAQLSELGEELGVVFQMRDDEIGLFADKETTGKPSGSDVAENKRTLLRLWLLDRAAADDRARLQSIFGTSPLNHEDLTFVRTKTNELGVADRSTDRIRELTERSRRGIDGLVRVTATGRALLQEIAAYNAARFS